MTFRPLPNPRQALLTCLVAAVAGLACAGLLAAATLAPAPPAALPVVIAVCIGCPVLAAWELPIAVTVLRLGREGTPNPATSRPLDKGTLSRLRRRLDDLPETEHPLGY